MSKRVLVVDDYEALGKSLVELLEVKGYEAVWIGIPSREMIEEVVKSFQPDALISDFYIGEVTGREVIAWTREFSPHILVILLSSINMQYVASELGCEFVPKGSENTDKRILELLAN